MILDIPASQLHDETMKRCRQNIRERCTREILQNYRSKPRHYANSLTHRIIFRQMQVLALLAIREPVWMDSYKELVLQHNHQPGVGHLLELLIAQTADAMQLNEMLREASTNGARRSIMMSMYHMYKRLGLDGDVAFKFSDELIPYTMGKDYGTRLFAQYICDKLLPDSNPMKLVCHRSLRMLDHCEENERMERDFRFSHPYGLPGVPGASAARCATIDGNMFL